MKWTLAVAAFLASTGCTTITQVEDLGNVRVIHTHSPLGVCGSTDAFLETRSGGVLVEHVSRHASSRDGRWMATVAWSSGYDFRLHVVDLEIPKVVFSFDLPDEDIFSGLGPELWPLSPDGARLLCQSHPRVRKSILEPDVESAIYLVSFGSDGGRCELIFREPRRMTWHVKWSPEGSSIAFLVALGEGRSKNEGWKLVQATPGGSPLLREVARTKNGWGQLDIVWEEGKPRLVER